MIAFVIEKMIILLIPQYPVVDFFEEAAMGKNHQGIEEGPCFCETWLGYDAIDFYCDTAGNSLSFEECCLYDENLSMTAACYCIIGNCIWLVAAGLLTLIDFIVDPFR